MRVDRLLLCLACGTLTLSSAEPLHLITSGTTNGITAAGNSFAGSITPDGRHVVFISHANNLVTNDDLRWHSDVFVRDLENGVASLVSVNTTDFGGGDGNSGYASISGHGRYVLFSSAAGNLVPNDTNGVSDVFRRDLQRGTTELVSVAISGGVPSASLSGPLLGSAKPVMTSDARWIAFESAAMDLVARDTNRTRKVFVRDMDNGVTFLASVGATQSSSSNLSSNGTRVAFLARASDVMAGSANILGDVFVRDLQTQSTFWASTNVPASMEGAGGYRCFNPTIARDGSFVAFKGVGTYAEARTFAFLHDLENGVTTLLARNTHPNTAMTVRANGRVIAFEDNGNVYIRDLENGTNLLVSVNSAGTGAANGSSHGPVLTPDGRHVAFVSSATNLVIDSSVAGTNEYRVYVRDIALGVTRVAAPVAVSEAIQPAITGNGQGVLFDSNASTVVPDDNNEAYDVFLRRIDSGDTVLVSAAHPERAPITGIQSARILRNSISADAQRIAFVSLDDPRVANDTNAYPDVFVFDRAAQSTIPQSTDGSGNFIPTNRAFDPVISAGGNYVVFAARAQPEAIYSLGGHRVLWRAVDSGPTKELTNSPGIPYWNIAPSTNGTVFYANASYLYRADMIGESITQWNFRSIWQVALSPDERWLAVGYNGLSALHVESNYVVRITHGSNGAPSSAHAFGGFSGSGRYCVYSSFPAIYRYEFQSGSTELVSSDGIEPSADFSGDFIAFTSRDFSVSYQVYVVDLASGRTELISANAPRTAPGNNSSRRPLISGDGRYVVFDSLASDLVLGDDNSAQDIFIHDRVQKTTMLVSRNYRGTGSGNSLSSLPVLARDGRTVVFQSFANDLVEGDYNEERDIFLLRLGVGDSDNDGMDDDWEAAYFDGLDRNGAEDFDRDGHSDLQEFLSGTDPTNRGSILRVLTVNPMAGGQTTVLWSAVPNCNYVVQFRDSLNVSQWTNASGVLTAGSTSESFAHASSAAQRYYRVIKVQ